MKAFFIQPHIWFFQETKGDKHAKGLFACLQVREKSLLELIRCWLELQLYFQNRNTNAIEEFKQDGLLMLKFSNSQSRKEFTLQGGYYRDYASVVVLADISVADFISNHIDVSRNMQIFSHLTISQLNL